VIGALLAVTAFVLINLNRRFLVGQAADPRVRAAAFQALLDAPEVARLTYLRLEIVGPGMVSVIGDVDLTGDDTESQLAVRLRALEARISVACSRRRRTEPLRALRADARRLRSATGRPTGSARCLVCP
jgi:hypothetical protein